MLGVVSSLIPARVKALLHIAPHADPTKKRHQLRLFVLAINVIRNVIVVAAEPAAAACRVAIEVRGAHMLKFLGVLLANQDTEVGR